MRITKAPYMHTNETTKVTAVPKEHVKWGDGVVRYKEFLAVVLTMIVVGGTLFGFIFNLHQSQTHPTAADHGDVEVLHGRIDRLEARTVNTLERIELKIDKLSTK